MRNEYCEWKTASKKIYNKRYISKGDNNANLRIFIDWSITLPDYIIFYLQMANQDQFTVSLIPIIL